jgi:uncharacterized protein (TIGR02996 family)
MPPTDQLAFWAAIRANPDDDTPRLVYADWLDENGDAARAEFIRVQRALAKLPDDERKNRKLRATLESRQKALLRANRKKWIAPFRAALKGARVFHYSTNAWFADAKFRRGFLPLYTMSLDGLRRLAQAGDACEPPDEVRVGDGSPNNVTRAMAQIAAWPGAGCVTGLSLGHWSRLTDETVAAMVRTENLRNLNCLMMFYCAITDKGAALLANWPCAASLKELHLATNPIGDAGAFALADSAYLTRLTHLDVSGTRIGKLGWKRLRDRFGDRLAIGD